jgi:hypothetical protein
MEGFYKANLKHIRAIVTFNLDSLLQEYTRARYNNPGLLRTIERATQSPDISKISVYHMHGLLRFDNKAKQAEKEAADAVVLTEQDYYNFFNDPMSLFNYTFMYLLREYSCLFIGLSMQDENIRRLLHYSREERRQSYLKKHPNESEDDAVRERVESYLKKRPGKQEDDAIEELVQSLQHDLKKLTNKTEDKAIERSCRHFAILQHSDSPATDDAVENSLLALGTHVLWIANYDQIPTLLAKIYNSPSYKWDQVY